MLLQCHCGEARVCFVSWQIDDGRSSHVQVENERLLRAIGLNGFGRRA
jgi:hypothetical protein